MCDENWKFSYYFLKMTKMKIYILRKQSGRIEINNIWQNFIFSLNERLTYKNLHMLSFFQ